MYRMGYLNAGNALADKSLNSGNDLDCSYLAIPCIANYRQYAELELKDGIDLLMAIGWRAVSLGADTSDKTQRLRDKTGHDLIKLMSLFGSLLEDRAGAEYAADSIGEMQTTIRWFADIDPKGDRLRYPLTLKRQPQYSESKHVDLQALKAAVTRFADFFYELHRELRQDFDPEASESEHSDRTYFW